MSICFSGLDIPCGVQPVTIDVSPAHPLIQVAQVIPWQALADMVLPDLQRTTAQGKWWVQINKGSEIRRYSKWRKIYNLNKI